VLLIDTPTFPFARICQAELAASHALAGDVDAAVDWLRRAERLTGRAGLFDAWLERDRAWVLAVSGDVPAAASCASRAALLARDAGQLAFEALALYDAARFGTPRGAGRPRADQSAVARLADLARVLGDGVVPELALGAAALRLGDATALDRVSAALAETGHLLYAAEAAAEAHRRHNRDGLRLPAKASLGRATELAQRCAGARTHLLDLSGTEGSLTARELHVATLAAAGRSGPAIAEALGLSVRTVNNHLGRIYAKLGIAGRGELAEVIPKGSRSSTRIDVD
jgi:DNA-binding CsgD family transcriptional regulator